MAADAVGEAKESIFAQFRDHVRERILPKAPMVEATPATVTVTDLKRTDVPPGRKSYSMGDLVKDDIAALHAIDDRLARFDAARLIGARADRNAEYRAELERSAPEAFMGEVKAAYGVKFGTLQADHQVARPVASPKIASAVEAAQVKSERQYEERGLFAEYVPPAWQGQWSTTSDGLHEVKDVVHRNADGTFQPGYELSHRGGEPAEGVGASSFPMLEEAKHAASTLAREVHSALEGPEQQLRAIAQAGPAEVGKTYQGVIVEADGAHVLQSVKESGRERLVRHERGDLYGARSESLPIGSNVQIRYPLERIAVVSDLGAKQIHGRATQGLSPKGLGD